jgi:hypothetical protein
MPNAAEEIAKLEARIGRLEEIVNQMVGDVPEFQNGAPPPQPAPPAGFYAMPPYSNVPFDQLPTENPRTLPPGPEQTGMQPRPVPSPADFEKARGYVLRFGKFKDSTLEGIAVDNQGILYLDWLLKNGNKLHKATVTALEDFLGHPQVQRNLAAAERQLENNKRRR